MFFEISCLRRRHSSSKGPGKEQNGDRAVRWVCIVAGLRRFCSALRRCCHTESGAPTSEDDSLAPVSRRPTKKILRDNEVASRAFRGDQWRVVRELGRGSYALVLLVKNRTTEELLAKKYASSFTRPDPVQEAVIHVQLKHENIVKLVCWTKTNVAVSIFMEYCSGGTLLNVIGKLNQEDIGRYFDQLSSAVDYLHSQGVAHRDLKPENLLLTGEGVLKVADFGLAAVFIVDGKEVLLERHEGTRLYMAPEVLLKTSKYAAPPTDLWSCGLILFNMVTVDRPWKRANLNDSDYKRWVDKDEALSSYPKWNTMRESCWRTLLEALLSPDPQERLSGWRSHRKDH
ncbi:serine/threonine-protein kinase Chk1-like [Oratosquilla oratoria]|uniref:serine/threonine-protein kinase Chk1-like n=1 Tax=Oratosquilla oratoria TaxID=337810 RepID=UPI003F76A07D